MRPSRIMVTSTDATLTAMSVLSAFSSSVHLRPRTGIIGAHGVEGPLVCAFRHTINQFLNFGTRNRRKGIAGAGRRYAGGIRRTLNSSKPKRLLKLPQMPFLQAIIATTAAAPMRMRYQLPTSPSTPRSPK